MVAAHLQRSWEMPHTSSAQQPTGRPKSECGVGCVVMLLPQTVCCCTFIREDKLRVGLISSDSWLAGRSTCAEELGCLTHPQHSNQQVCHCKHVIRLTLSLCCAAFKVCCTADYELACIAVACAINSCLLCCCRRRCCCCCCCCCLAGH
jgi:hypothetical protein